MKPEVSDSRLSAQGLHELLAVSIRTFAISIGPSAPVSIEGVAVRQPAKEANRSQPILLIPKAEDMMRQAVVSVQKAFDKMYA